MVGAAVTAVFSLLLAGSHLAAGCRSPIVEIYVSPLASKKTPLRVMDIVWDVGGNWKRNDWVGLYDKEPAYNVQPLFHYQVTSGDGSVRTNIEEGRKHEEPNFNKRCLGWWVAYWHAMENNTVAVSCLSSNPRWMEEHKNEIGNLRLNNMFLPGTHDSGAFYLAYKPFSVNRIDKYVYTQDETVMEQLISGARLLDLRVGVHNGKFWIYHGIVRIRPLEYVLHDVKTFVENTNEIVILDVHEFPRGFNNRSKHFELIKFIQSILEPHLAPPVMGWGASLNSLWDANKRVILAYNEKSIVREKPHDVWWPVTQKWGNKRDIYDLWGYFVDWFRSGAKNGGVVWSAMAELTPTFYDVFLDKFKGLRGMADRENKIVTSWFRGEWGNTVNGVSVDFLRSTGIVDAAIRWNRRRARGSSCD